MTTPIALSAMATPANSIYACALGPLFHRLAPALARLHGTGERCLIGTLRVRVSARPSVRFLLRLARMPRANAAAACRVMLASRAHDEVWRRMIDGTRFVTVQTAGADGTIIERVGPLAIYLHLHVVRGELRMRSYATRIFGLPLPALLRVNIVARERPVGADAIYSEIRARSPLCGPLIRYSGLLRFEPAAELRP